MQILCRSDLQRRKILMKNRHGFDKITPLSGCKWLSNFFFSLLCEQKKIVVKIEMRQCKLYLTAVYGIEYIIIESLISILVFFFCCGFYPAFLLVMHEKTISFPIYKEVNDERTNWKMLGIKYCLKLCMNIQWSLAKWISVHKIAYTYSDWIVQCTIANGFANLFSVSACVIWSSHLFSILMIR